MAKPNFTLPNKPAIKSGSILSYNYTDDFTFVPAPLTFNRDSAATRVNEKGLIEDVGYFGPELVQNGDFSEIGPELVTNGSFDTDSNWIKQTGVTISNGAAHWDGTQTSNTRCYQVITSLVQGKQYKVVFTATITSGAIFANVKGNSSGTSRTTSGTYTETIIGGSSDNNFLLVGDDNFIGSIDNVSVKEVGQNWSFGTGWSVDQANNKAVFDGGADAAIQQLNVVENGKKYKFKIDVNDRTSGSLQIRFGSTGSVDATISSNGSYVYNFTSDGTTLYLRAISGFNGSITNISVIEVLGDKPRIDYSDSLTEPSLLLEPQSTNLVTYSEDFTKWVKEATVTLTSNYGVSPDGTQNSTRVQMDINDSVYISATSGNNFSIYVKGVQGETIRISNGGSLTHTLTGEWDRISLYDTGNSSSLISINTYSVTTARDIEIWGAQLEALSYPTSYIPTSGSTATRLGETANNAGDVNVFNSEEGVLYAEIAALKNEGDNEYISISNGTNDERLVLGYVSNNNIRVFVRSGGSFYATTDINLSNALDYNKIAFKYKSGDNIFYLNGNKVNTNTDTYSLSAFNVLNFSTGNALSNYFYGKVRNIQVFNKALTDRELEILTIQ